MFWSMPGRIADTILERNRAPLPRPAAAPVQRRALVTGGAGFVGSHLVDALLAAGWSVAVLDDLSTGRRENVPGGVTLWGQSVTDKEDVRSAVNVFRPDVIFHLAAQSSYRLGDTDPQTDVLTNVLGTVNVLQAAAAHGSPRVVLASSAGGVYGETYGLVATEAGTGPNPRSVYGASKAAAEMYCRVWHERTWHERYALPVTILRLANVYGPRQQPGGEAGVVSIFAGQCLRGEPMTVRGDGTQTRDFVYVADVVRAFIAAADASAPTWGVYNVGSGTETAINRIADTLAHEVGGEHFINYTPAIPGEFQHLALDVYEAARVLGWRASTPLAEGIAATVAWVREQMEAAG